MSGEPKGGLTWEREKGVMVAAAAPLALLDFVLQILIPDLPLFYPFAGALLTQILLAIPFRGLYRPVEQPRLTRFLAATVLAASAIMVGAALTVRAMGWGEYSFPSLLAGFGGTMWILWLAQRWLFRTMIQRHDGTPDEGEAQA